MAGAAIMKSAPTDEGVGKIAQDGFLRPLEERPCEGKDGSEIPVIDIGAAVHGGGGGEEAVRAVAEQVGRACEEWGFFEVVNHGIPPSLLLRLRQASKDFFQLPSELKRKVHKNKGGLGYYHGQITNNARDWREVFDMSASEYLELPDNSDFLADEQHTCIFHNQWPSDDMPHVRVVCEEYMLEARKLAFTLLRLMWQSLGLPPTQCEEYFAQSKMHRFRFNHYLPCSEPGLVLGVGAHTDVGALTVLLQDEVGGLQVRRKDGEWINVQPNIPMSLVINVADAMQVLTNDKYRSVEHRVVVKKNVDRYSFPFSLSVAPWVNLAPIMELTSEKNPPKYKPINWGKYLKCQIDSSFKNVGIENTLLCYFNVDEN